MAVTRINNNQITDAATGNTLVGINAGTKLQNYSITATKIANNLTYGSNLTVTGNLTVQGNTTAIDTTITTIEDPVILLASNQTGVPAVDIGYIGQRGVAENIAFVWQESSSEFIAAYTTTAETDTTITVTGYANVHSNDMTVGGNLAVTGTTSLAGNIISDANVTGDITGGNVYSNGTVSAVGDVAGANLTTGGTVSSTGDITGGNINTAGTVSATGTVTGGDINTGGNVSATGNVLGGNLSTSGNVYAAYVVGNISGNVTAPGANTQVIYNDGGLLKASSGLTFTKTSNALSVGGTVTGGNLETAGTVSATGDVSGANFSVTGNIVPTANVTYSLGNALNKWSSLYVSGNTVYMGNLQIKNPEGNTFAVYRNDGVTLADINTNTLSATGDVTGGNLATGGTVSATGTVTGGNLETGGTISGTGTITGGNVQTGGTVSATGTVTGGNVQTGGEVSASGTITGGDVNTGGNVSAGGNVIGGNLVTGGVGGNIIGNGNIAIGGYVSAVGNVTGANIITGGYVTATGNISTSNYFTGNGRYLTGVAAESVNANTLTGNTLASGVIYSSLTTVGTLVSLSVTGDTTSGNLATGGTVSATGTITGGNVETAGTMSATGDVTGGNLATGGTVSATGTVTGGNLATGGTISGTGTITGGNLETGGTVSATGTITSSNTITGGNLATGGNVSASGDVTGANLYTGGTVSATSTITGGNVETAGYVSATGDVTGGNLATGGTVSATGNIDGANVNAPQVYGASTLTLAAGTGNIILGTTGNVVLANTFINGVAYPTQDQDAASKIYVDNLVSTGLTFHPPVYAATTTDLATTTGGTVTYTQPNGAGNGVAAYLQTTGSFNLIDTANVQTANTRILVKNEGNAAWNGVYGWANATTIVRTTDTDEYGPDSTEQLSLNDYFFTTTGNVNGGTAFVVSAPAGTITFGTSDIEFSIFSQSLAYTANTAAGITLTGTVISAKVDNDTTAFDVGGNISVKAGANLTTPNIGAATGTSLSVTGTVTGGNLETGGTISGTGTITGGNLETGGTVSSTGNITGGNVNTGGAVSATGTITGGNILTSGAGGDISGSGNIIGGNVLTGGILSATGDVTGGNLTTGGTVSSTGTVTGGNLETSGTISATSTITGGNVNTGGAVSATGDITGGNLYTSGQVSATGNITVAPGSYYIGDGSQLTGVAASSVDAGNLVGNTLSANVTFSSLTSVGNLTTLSVVGTATVGNVSTAGFVSATGDITGGNIYTGGESSTTGTITGGNVNTGGTVSATGTITGGNLATGGTISGTGTVTGGNVETGGYVSASGDVTGANLYTSGQVSSTGDVTGGNLATGGTVSSTGTITGGNVETGGTVSATSTITGGNVVTGGVVSAIGDVTGGNLYTGGAVSAQGNIQSSGAFSATGNVQGGNILTAGYVSATGNIYADNFVGNVTGNVTLPSAGNTLILFNNAGNLGFTPGISYNRTTNAVSMSGNLNLYGSQANLSLAGNGTIFFGTSGSTYIQEDLGTNYLDVKGNAGVTIETGYATGNIDIHTNGGTATYDYTGNLTVPGTVKGSNIETGGQVSALGNVTGGNLIVASGGIDSGVANLFLNASQLNVNTGIYDSNGNIVFYVAGSTGTASFGDSGQITNSVVTFNATNSIRLPVGNTVQRPGSGTTGQFRFNTTINSLEIYDNSQWTTVGQPAFTVITDQQFNGDGSTTTFTLSGNATTSSTIVSINGVTQIPVTAYAVSGDQLVFTEAPATADLIDVRVLTTTTTVTSISNASGNASVACLDTSATTLITGDLEVTGNVTITGNVATNQISSGSSAVQIPVPNGNVDVKVNGANVVVWSTAGEYVTGNISATGDVIAQNVNSLSDATLKENVTPIENAGSTIDQLHGVGYNWKDGSGHAYGMVAQQVEEVLPEAVRTDDNGIKSVNYQMVIPFLVETIKELRQDIAEIKAQLKK